MKISIDLDTRAVVTTPLAVKVKGASFDLVQVQFTRGGTAVALDGVSIEFGVVQGATLMAYSNAFETRSGAIYAASVNFAGTELLAAIAQNGVTLPLSFSAEVAWNVNGEKNRSDTFAVLVDKPLFGENPVAPADPVFYPGAAAVRTALTTIAGLGSASSHAVTDFDAAGTAASAAAAVQETLSETIAAKEPALGNPDRDGALLSATAAGVRSWTRSPSLDGLSLTDPAGTTTMILSFPNDPDWVGENVATISGWSDYNGVGCPRLDSGDMGIMVYSTTGGSTSFQFVNPQTFSYFNMGWDSSSYVFSGAPIVFDCDVSIPRGLNITGAVNFYRQGDQVLSLATSNYYNFLGSAVTNTMVLDTSSTGCRMVAKTPEFAVCDDTDLGPEMLSANTGMATNDLALFTPYWTLNGAGWTGYLISGHYYLWNNTAGAGVSVAQAAAHMAVPFQVGHWYKLVVGDTSFPAAASIKAGGVTMNQTLNQCHVFIFQCTDATDGVTLTRNGQLFQPGGANGGAAWISCREVLGGQITMARDIIAANSIKADTLHARTAFSGAVALPGGAALTVVDGIVTAYAPGS